MVILYEKSHILSLFNFFITNLLLNLFSCIKNGFLIFIAINLACTTFVTSGKLILQFVELSVVLFCLKKY